MSNAPHPAAAPGDAWPQAAFSAELLDAIADAVLLADEQGRIVLWNPAATRLLGYEMDEALGMNVAELVPPEESPRHEAAVETYRRTGRGRLLDTGKPYETVAIRKDGSRVHVDITLSRVQHQGASYVLAIVRDVNDRVIEREGQERHRKQLQDAIDSLEAFAHVIAHDLKEPVRGMGAYLEELEADPDAHDRADKIHRAATANRNLRGLLEGLLEWSRTTMTPLEPRPLRLHEVLAASDCQAQWLTLQRERGARVDISTEIPPILGTEELVCRVFGNLITNAIRHNPDPAPRVSIRAEEGARAGRVVIVVEDNGPGFPPRLIQRVQSMANRPSTIKGGFGLAITRRAVERLQGSMRLANAPSGGAIVRVDFPAPETETTIEERVRELV